ncbi:MAG TPA: hypothetical protein EYP04_06935 [Anaerolineae bacterium]|nr:hypothetical protein [Anaerolineae bacterium]
MPTASTLIIPWQIAFDKSHLAMKPPGCGTALVRTADRRENADSAEVCAGLLDIWILQHPSQQPVSHSQRQESPNGDEQMSGFKHAQQRAEVRRRENAGGGSIAPPAFPPPAFSAARIC